ncbi:MAG: hypothetical protein JWM80_1843 [Cyanobacteria bacterium RYN_339]|nr:hypothetical protein [Cyanobacteria bacterium RYN_339]
MSENLRKYLSEVPILAELLDGDLQANRSNATNTEEQRHHLEDIQTKLCARLKDEKTLYATKYYPEQEQSCPICKEILFGYYWELNNPVSAKAACISYKLFHAFTQHDQGFITESMQNVTGVRVGEMRMVLDLGAILSVMKNSSAPPELLAECEAAIEIQKQRLAAAEPIAAGGGGH